MENYRNLMETNFNSLENLFEEIESLFTDLRVNSMLMNFNEEIEDNEYYTHVKETFDKLSDKICKMCHTLGESTSATEKMLAKTGYEGNPLLDFITLNLTVHMKKHRMYTEMYEEFKFFGEEADKFFSMKQ